MSLDGQAASYVATHGLRSTMIASNCRRFLRAIGQRTAEQVTSADLQQFRQVAMAAGLSHVTIEKTITDVATIVKAITGIVLSVGRRLRQSRPEPVPVPISDINATWQASTPWLRQWIVLTYWTALRLCDSMGLQLSLPLTGDAIRWRAGKTSHCHVYPVPSWLATHLLPLTLPYKHAGGHSVKIMRDHLHAACMAAGVPYWNPQRLRQRSITEWTRANATAGQHIHGCGIGVLSHYLDPLSVLESAAPQVRLPACFGASVDNAERMTAAYQRLDQHGQQLVLQTAERLGR